MTAPKRQRPHDLPRAREDEPQQGRNALARQAHAFTTSLNAKIVNWRCSRESTDAKAATLATIALSCTNRGWTVQETADYIGCEVDDVQSALTRGLRALAKVEVIETQAYRAKIAGRLESLDSQLQALADAADSPDTAIRALEARRKTIGDLATLYGANASKVQDDSADAIADLLQRTAHSLSEADRTSNEPALHLVADHRRLNAED